MSILRGCSGNCILTIEFSEMQEVCETPQEENGLGGLANHENF